MACRSDLKKTGVQSRGDCQMEHDYYSLEEAAKVAECSVNDLLKLGAAGKIKVCAFYNGQAYITTDPDFAFFSWLQGLRHEGNELDADEARLLFNELLPIRAEDLLSFYQSCVKDQSTSMSARFEFPAYKKSGQFVYPYDFAKGCKVSIAIDTKSLFIRKEDLHKALSKPEGTTPEYLDPRHPCHSWALHIAIEAWQYFYSEAESKKSVSEDKIEKWIKSKYPWVTKSYRDRMIPVIRAIELDKAAP
jgi:hypothetical protein